MIQNYNKGTESQVKASKNWKEVFGGADPSCYEKSFQNKYKNKNFILNQNLLNSVSEQK
jgi:hypothetical protein